MLKIQNQGKNKKIKHCYAIFRSSSNEDILQSIDSQILTHIKQLDWWIYPSERQLQKWSKLFLHLQATENEYLKIPYIGYQEYNQSTVSLFFQLLLPIDFRHLKGLTLSTQITTIDLIVAMNCELLQQVVLLNCNIVHIKALGKTRWNSLRRIDLTYNSIHNFDYSRVKLAQNYKFFAPISSFTSAYPSQTDIRIVVKFQCKRIKRLNLSPQQKLTQMYSLKAIDSIERIYQKCFLRFLENQENQDRY